MRVWAGSGNGVVSAPGLVPGTGFTLKASSHIITRFRTRTRSPPKFSVISRTVAAASGPRWALKHSNTCVGGGVLTGVQLTRTVTLPELDAEGAPEIVIGVLGVALGFAAVQVSVS